jgi:hypothetical protein
MTPKATPLQSPGSDAPPSLSQDQIEFREEKNETVENTEDFHVEKPPDQPQQVPDIAGQTDAEMKPSLEENCSVAVESKPVTQEKDIHEEVEQKEIQPVEPSMFQDETVEKLETAEHPEHIEPEVDMTGSVINLSVSCNCSSVLLSYSFKWYCQVLCVLDLLVSSGKCKVFRNVCNIQGDHK